MRVQTLFAVVSTFSASVAFASQLAMPPLPHVETPFSSGEPTLFDLLVIDRRGSIFSDYVRNAKDIASRLNDRRQATTVLVPTNKAVLALARKPHQGPPVKTGQGEVEISESEQNRISDENAHKWVSAHVIPEHPISLSSTEPFPTLLEGTTIQFTEAQTASGDWEHYVMYPDVKIISKTEAANGVLYMIEGTVSYYD